MIRSRRDRFTLTVAFASLSTVAFGATASAQSFKPERASSGTPAPNEAAVAQLQSMSDAFATIAARVRPSVVYITAKQPPRTVANRGRANPQFPGLPPEMQRFFEMPGMRSHRAPASSCRRTATSSRTITSSTAPRR